MFLLVYQSTRSVNEVEVVVVLVDALLVHQSTRTVTRLGSSRIRPNRTHVMLRRANQLGR